MENLSLFLTRKENLSAMPKAVQHVRWTKDDSKCQKLALI